MRCIYCLRYKPPEDFGTVEHVWPQALGCKSAPDVFMTDRVCNWCNHTCGQHVDGLYVKSILINNVRQTASHGFLSRDKPRAVHPAFMGEMPDFPAPDGWKCDVYIGPLGTQFFHVRPEGDEHWWAYVGGDPRKQSKAKQGRVYIIHASDHPFWVLVNLKTLKATFPTSRRYSITVIEGDKRLEKFALPLPSGDREIDYEVAFIKSRNSDGIKVRQSFFEGFSDRFAAKLCLGLGHNILGDDYLETADARDFSERLWEKDYDARKKLPFHASGYDFVHFEGYNIMRSNGSWVICIKVLGDMIALTVADPFQRGFSGVISREAALMQAAAEKLGMGHIYVATPALGSFLGPFDLMSYIAHRTSSRRIPEIAAVEDQYHCGVDHLPPRFAKDDPELLPP